MTGTVFVCCSSGADPNSRIWPRIKSLNMVQDAEVFINLHSYVVILVITFMPFT